MITLKCKMCREHFQGEPDAMCCSVRCALAYIESPAGKRAAKRVKTRANTAYKKAHESRATLTKRAQLVFNQWIRLRDKGKPCVSCGFPDNGKRQRHASHFKPAGSNPPRLRWNEDNCHTSCSICNNFKSGNLVPYRAELIRRIGQARVDFLEGPQPRDKLTLDELREIASDYRARLKCGAFAASGLSAGLAGSRR